MTKNFSFENWMVGFTALMVIVIGLFDLAGWIPLSVDHLAQITMVGLGILMSSTVIRATKQKTEMESIKNEFQKFVGDHVDFKEFSRIEYGIDHMSRNMLHASRKIDHASISPPVPRHYPSMIRFEQSLEDVAINSHVKIRYLAKTDDYRLKRIQKFLINPLVNTYYVKTLNPDNLSIPMMNFMIIDNEEIIFAIPSFGEGYTFVSTKSNVIINAFEGYFNLLWAEAEEINRSTFASS